jgi:AsmA protein
MKPLKLLAIALGAIVVLVLGALVAVFLLVDPNAYKGTIERRVAQSTGREFRIEGRLALSVFPWVALDVGRVTLGNPPGVAGPPLLAAERVRVGVKLLPLLGKRLEVRRIAVDGLAVALVTRADGHTNWEDLTRSRGGDAAGGGPGLTDANIAGLDLTRSRLTLVDQKARTTTRLRDLEVHTGALGGGRPSDVSLAGVLDAGDGTASTRFKATARAALDVARTTARLDGLVLDGERAAPAAGAAAAPAPVAFHVDSPALVLDWHAGTLAPATLAARWGKLPLTLEVKGEPLLGQRLVTGRFRVPDVAPRDVLAALGTKPPATRDPQALAHLGAEGEFRLTNDALELSRLAATLDRTRLSGTARVGGLAGDEHPIAFDLALDALDLDAYRAPAAPGNSPATAPAAAKAPPTALPFDLLRALALDGRLAIGRLTVGGLALTNVRLPVTASGGVLTLVPQAALYGGTLGGRGIRLDAGRSPARLEAAASLAGVDVAALVKAYAKSDRLSGRLEAKLDLAGTGTTDAALVDSLGGPITFAVTGGALEGVDLTYELARAQALFRQQPQPARAGPARTPFQSLAGTSTLAHGVLTSDPLKLDTAQLSVQGKGTFRLADQAIDYQLTATVREAQAPGAAGQDLTALRSLEIPLAISGTVQDYHVRPDVAGLAKARVRQELDQHKDELKQKAKDKLKEQLDKLFGH